MDNNNQEKSRFSVAFGQSNFLNFVYRKGEKLSSAIYLVTSLLKDDEPIKWQLREQSLVVMSDTANLCQSNLSDKRQTRNVLMSLAKILSLFEVASTANIISEMNISVLRRESALLFDTIDSSGSSDLPSGGLGAMAAPILSEGFFDLDSRAYSQDGEKSDNVPNYLFTNNRASADGSALSGKASLADAPIPVQKQNGGFSKGHSKMSFRTHSIGQSEKGSSGEGQGSKIGQIKDRSSERKALILAAIVKVKDIGISELVSVVKGCSEKTIQRDLIDMMKSGVLKKQGERRWSRYMLA